MMRRHEKAEERFNKEEFGEYEVRKLNADDLERLLCLYTHLHGNSMPEIDDSLRFLWSGIMADPNHLILGIEHENILIASCVLLIVPNLTHGQRPYAVIENVITHPDWRNRGCGSSVLQTAKLIAGENGCYKIMLMTGSKKDSTMHFYEDAGFNRQDKTAFVCWLS